MQEFPYYYANKIRMLNPSGSIGIITFWSQQSEFPLDELAKYNYMSIGNLYTRDGFKYIILNSFLSPNLRHLLFAGSDRNHIANDIIEFFDSPTSDMYQTMRKQLLHLIDFENHTMKDTPEHIVDHILTIFVLRYRNAYTIISSVELITRYVYISNVLVLSKVDIVPTLYKIKLATSADKFPSEGTGFISRSNNLQNLWLLIMKQIKSFGILRSNTDIPFDSDYYEIIDAMYVLQHKDRNIDCVFTDNPFKLDREFMQRYLPQIVSDETFEGLAYTYGNRIHHRGNIDVYNIIVDKLVNSNMSRHAYISLYDPTKDIYSPNPPCLTDITLNIQNNMLILSAHFRSHDVFSAMRMNMYGLCMLQQKIIDDINSRVINKNDNTIIPGDVIIFANSCHIYVRDYQKLSEVIFITDCTLDMRGYFIINVENDKVKVVHYNYANEALKSYTLSSINDLQIDELAYYVTNIHHAMYLQKEICKAFDCIKHGVEYKQDS